MHSRASVSRPARVVVVEDDAASRGMLSTYLAQEGYDVTACADAAALDRALARQPHDLALLDIHLPDRDGLSILKELRARGGHGARMGIVLVTARTDTVDRVVGLELGADDYVTKPYEQRELLARVRSVLRRVMLADTMAVAPTVGAFRFDDWTLDLPTRRLVGRDGPVALTTGEFDLLAALVGNAPRVMSRDQLLDAVAGREWTPSDRSVDVLIGRLRKKLDDPPAAPRYLVTVRNVGYVFAGSLA